MSANPKALTDAQLASKAARQRQLAGLDEDRSKKN